MHAAPKQTPTPLDWMRLADMAEWAGNPKKHPVENVEMIAASLKRYGFGSPIVLWGSERRIVAGHGRYRAALLRMKADPGLYLDKDAPGPGMVPVRVMEFSSQSEAAAYALTDNRSTEVNPMQAVDVAEVLRQIQEDGGDLSIPGWTDAEIAAMLGEAAEPDGTGGEDAGPGEPPAEPVSRTGEVYELGPHRLVCGDSRDADVWEKAVSAGEDYAICADPPYGIDLLKNDSPLGKSKVYRPIIGDSDEFDPAFIIGKAVPICLWGANHYANRLPNSDRWLVWDKQGGAKETTFSDCELAWCSERGPARHITHIWDGFRRDSERGVSRDHPNQKPVAVIVWALDHMASRARGVVVEPFGGSGTTLIACAKTGRLARLIEIDPRYCDVIRRRWTQYALSAGVDPGTGRLDV